ncbi:DMT family transporter [Bacillus salipaludis]|uniref:DMT family transporter n=1 Tax=Bacillus salipaludis TaxID=2547811 RepID=A0AA90QWW3_9BACI|nr:DMT family transporter [Bacillus salipaludis]MDQ6594950.1 DMT family transporter [Bacillus salipaludis]
MPKAQKYKIYLLLVFVMAAWGFNVIATKILVTTFPTLTITSIRVFTAAISVFLILSIFKMVRLPNKKELRYILAAGFFNVVCHHFFLSMGLAKTTASNGGLILGLGPLLSTIVAFLFLKSRVTIPKIVGIILGFSGVAFIVASGNGGLSLRGISNGDLFVFLSIFTQSYSFVLIKKISNTLDPRLMTGYMLLFGSIVLFFISLFAEPGGLKKIPHGSLEVWMIFLASAVIATAIGHMIYNSAIGKVGVTESAIFINLNPFFALVGAVLFLGEKISSPQILGFLFILFGVLFGSGALEEFLHQSRLKKMPAHRGNVKNL